MTSDNFTNQPKPIIFNEDDQYRIEFEEHTKDSEVVATICNITDLSNHYK